MKLDLSHEIYKFTHRRIPIYGILVLIGLMLYSASPSSNISPMLLAQGFGAGQWACIIMIALSSDMIAMEYRDYTMTTLMYKTSNKFTLYASKFIVLVAYSVVLLIIGVLFSFLLKAITIGAKYSWETTNYHSYSLCNALVLNMAGTFIYLIFIISLSLLLILLLKSNAMVIIIGLAIGFLGADLSNLSMVAFPSIHEFLSWSPLNMINIMTQFANKNVVNITHLTNSELIIGNLVYTIIFFYLGILVFRKHPI